MLMSTDKPVCQTANRRDLGICRVLNIINFGTYVHIALGQTTGNVHMMLGLDDKVCDYVKWSNHCICREIRAEHTIAHDT